MASLTATPASTQTGKPVQLQYTGGLGGSLRLTRPNGSRYYLPTSPGTGSKTYTPSTVGQHKADLFTRQSRPKIIASTSFAVTAIPAPPPVPVTPPPPANAVRVQVEGGQFVAAGGTVWYGSGSKWATRVCVAGSVVQCINDVFGDPIPYTRKECRAVVPAGELVAVAGNGWVELAWAL